MSKTIPYLISTDRFNQKIGYSKTKKECENELSSEEIITNPRFTQPRHRFSQLYFHAGDWRDVERYALLPSRMLQNNPIKKQPSPISYNFNSVNATFKYIFFHLKKGIYFSVRNSKVTVFCPFSNADYENPYSQDLYFFDKNKEKYNSRESINAIRKFSQKTKIDINPNKSEWIVNNCLLQFKTRGNMEGDHSTNIYKHLIETTCEEYGDIPDCDFFINRKDFPLLKTDYKDPYDHITNSYIPKKYLDDFRKYGSAPILSASTTEYFKDLALPTSDDWIREAGVFFFDWGKGCLKYEKPKNQIEWDMKIPKLIFRGSATGCGTIKETNIRLLATHIGTQYPDLLDIGITDLKARPKKYKNKPIEVIDKYSNKVSNMITEEEKFQYKYILNLDGYVSAFRLGNEIGSGCLVFKHESEYKTWIDYFLKDGVHYIKVKKDLSNLVDKVLWARENDDKCREIVKNATQLFNSNFNRKGVLEYTANLLKTIGKGFKKIPVSMYGRLAIITVYRDPGDGSRLKQKEDFIQIIAGLFEAANNYVDIFIIEQSQDGEKFNIGKLKNIGFIMAREKENKEDFNYSHFIFTDIDTFPDTDLMKYYLYPTRIKPIALATRGTRYQQENLTNKPFLGACMSISGETFEKINGYPNNIYGWGVEDDIVCMRCSFNGIEILIPKEGGVVDIEDINGKEISVMLKVKEIAIKESIRWEKFQIFEESGLDSTNYKLLETNVLNINNTSIIHSIVDLKKKEDELLYPSWFPKANSKLKNAPKFEHKWLVGYISL